MKERSSFASYLSLNEVKGWLIYMANEKTFKIFGGELVISEGRDNYNRYRKKYDEYAQNAAAIYLLNFEENFSSLDDLYENGDDVEAEIIVSVMDKAIDDLVANGVYNVDMNKFISYYVDNYHSSPALDAAKEAYEEIMVSLAEEIEYREDKRDNRARWYGGGVGLGGAIAGSVMAGGLNMASGLMHSLFNSIGNSISRSNARSSLKSYYKNENVRKQLALDIYRNVWRIHFAVCDILLSNGMLIQFVTQKESEDAEAMFNNLGRIPDKKSVLLKILSFDPYNEDYYTYALLNNVDNIEEIGKTAHYFSVHIEEPINVYIMFNTIISLRRLADEGMQGTVTLAKKNELAEYKITDKEDLLEYLLDSYGMKKEDIRLSEEELGRIDEKKFLKLREDCLIMGQKQYIKQTDNMSLGLLDSLYEQMKTFRGTVYSNVEEKKRAQTQFDELSKAIAETDKKDRDALLKLKNEIEALKEFDDNKKHFTKQLSKEISKSEKKILDSRLKAAESKSVSELIKERIETDKLDYDSGHLKEFTENLDELIGQAAEKAANSDYESLKSLRSEVESASTDSGNKKIYLEQIDNAISHAEQSVFTNRISDTIRSYGLADLIREYTGADKLGYTAENTDLYRSRLDSLIKSEIRQADADARAAVQAVRSETENTDMPVQAKRKLLNTIDKYTALIEDKLLNDRLLEIASGSIKELGEEKEKAQNTGYGTKQIDKFIDGLDELITKKGLKIILKNLEGADDELLLQLKKFMFNSYSSVKNGLMQQLDKYCSDKGVSLPERPSPAADGEKIDFSRILAVTELMTDSDIDEAVNTEYDYPYEGLNKSMYPAVYRRFAEDCCYIRWYDRYSGEILQMCDRIESFSPDEAYEFSELLTRHRCLKEIRENNRSRILERISDLRKEILSAEYAEVNKDDKNALIAFTKRIESLCAEITDSAVRTDYWLAASGEIKRIEEADMARRAENIESKSHEELSELLSYLADNIITEQVKAKYTAMTDKQIDAVEEETVSKLMTGADKMTSPELQKLRREIEHLNYKAKNTDKFYAQITTYERANVTAQSEELLESARNEGIDALKKVIETIRKICPYEDIYTKFVNRHDSYMCDAEQRVLEDYISDIDNIPIPQRQSKLNRLAYPPYSDMHSMIVADFCNKVRYNITTTKLRKFGALCRNLKSLPAYAPLSEVVLFGIENNEPAQDNIGIIQNVVQNMEDFETIILICVNRGMFSNINGVIVSDKKIRVVLKSAEILVCGIDSVREFIAEIKMLSSKLLLMTDRARTELPVKADKQQIPALKELFAEAVRQINAINAELNGGLNPVPDVPPAQYENEIQKPREEIKTEDIPTQQTQYKEPVISKTQQKIVTDEKVTVPDQPATNNVDINSTLHRMQQLNTSVFTAADTYRAADFNKRLSKARSAYANYGETENPVLLYDSSVFGSGKVGFVLTDYAIYIKPDFFPKEVIPIAAIKDIVKKENGKGLITLYVIDENGKEHMLISHTDSKPSFDEELKALICGFKAGYR